MTVKSRDNLVSVSISQGYPGISVKLASTDDTSNAV